MSPFRELVLICLAVFGIAFLHKGSLYLPDWTTISGEGKIPVIVYVQFAEYLAITLTVIWVISFVTTNLSRLIRLRHRSEGPRPSPVMREEHAQNAPANSGSVPRLPSQVPPQTKEAGISIGSVNNSSLAAYNFGGTCGFHTIPREVMDAVLAERSHRLPR